MHGDNLLDMNTLREEVTHQIVDFILEILDVHVIRILDVCVSRIVSLMGMVIFNFALANNILIKVQYSYGVNSGHIKFVDLKRDQKERMNMREK